MKTPQMQAQINSLAQALFGRQADGKICVTCGNEVGAFKDALSQKEFKISGMCQKCQDSVFG